MQYQKQLTGESPQAELEGSELLPFLNMTIRGTLGNQFETSDIWHYFAERLTAADNDPSKILKAQRLREVMTYWRAKQPNNPRGLTKAEQVMPQESMVLNLNQIIRTNLGTAHVNPDIWNYYAKRLTLPSNRVESITTRSRLHEVMSFWWLTNPTRPRGADIN
jgi:hypothetical protein